MDPRYAAYGSVAGILGGKPTAKTLANEAAIRRRPALPFLVGCLFVPWLLFVTTFWLRSFELRRDAEPAVDLLCYCLLTPVLAFAYMTFNLLRTGDPNLMAFLTMTSLLAWIVAFSAGNSNYEAFMKPYYDISNLNVYPTVDPSKYVGNQLMDAGMVQFTQGSALKIDKSIGFKNEDVYCVAPIVSSANANQSTYDFWAVGMNCCSGHLPDFHCGEYTNPMARWGLRLLDHGKEDMFRLAVKEAEATFNLKAPAPMFLYWLSDPTTEMNAYKEDGFNFFLRWAFGAFAVQFFLVLCGAGYHATI